MRKLTAALALVVVGLTTSTAQALPIGMCGGDFGPDPRPTTITGTNGDDRIEGTDETDVIEGLDGDDRIFARDGTDWLCGNRGHDHLRGHRGEDQLFGGPGDDVLYAGPGSDLIQGQQGNDVLEVIDSSVTAGSRDFVWGGAGNDIIGVPVTPGGATTQNRGQDHFQGGLGDDVLYVADGNNRDTVFGGRGFDTCYIDPDDHWENCEVLQRFE
jgi:Ca2+-binding RTX toxin-like protein